MRGPKHLVSLAFLLFLSSVAIAQNDKSVSPRLVKKADALLLEGFETLFLVTPEKTTKLESPDQSRTAFGYRLSPDGKRVTGVLSKSSRWEKAIEGSIFTLSLETGSWFEHLNVSNLEHPPSISRDGSKLSFSAADGLHVFDLNARKDQVVSPSLTDVDSPEWSPDGTLIAFEVALPQRDPHFDHHESEIRILNIASGISRLLVAHGRAPKWSPSGEWIAYLDDTKDPGSKQCFLIRPDGGAAHPVATAPHTVFGSGGAFWGSPIWAPDSDKLLLNVYWDWYTLKTSVYELDLKTHHLSRLLKDVEPVWAWASLKRTNSER